jgi:hypothetical protein
MNALRRPRLLYCLRPKQNEGIPVAGFDEGKGG